MSEHRTTGAATFPVHDMQVEMVSPSSLHGYEGNPRKNDDAVPRMCDAIKEFGFRVPVLALRDGTVIDGHLRLKAAAVLQLPSVPVIWTDGMTPEQVRAFRILVNSSVAWAEWDDQLLAQELEALQAADFDLSMTGLSDAEIEALMGGADDGPDEDPGLEVEEDSAEPDLFECPACGHVNTKKAFRKK